MKWLKIIVTIVEYLIPVLAKVGKDRAVKQLEVVTTGVEKFSKSATAGDKGKAVKGVICDLAIQTGIAKRLHKRIKKFESTIWKKLF